MARPTLGSLLSTASDTGVPPEPVEAPPAAPEAAPAALGAAEKPNPAPNARERRTKTPARQRRAAPVAEPATHWSEYERLEARLREDQVVQLDALVRRLNKQRSGAGERITKNTLLRVATDLLISKGDAVTGGTETEIREAVLSD